MRSIVLNSGPSTGQGKRRLGRVVHRSEWWVHLPTSLRSPLVEHPLTNGYPQSPVGVCPTSVRGQLASVGVLLGKQTPPPLEQGEESTA
mmetsp:Transcript_92875/g.160926  ORF Transcript_92875/g.160926 Transcript_92875/m.160926 type:complete len:89 (-) Transcript_92875:784-1050(-)